MLSPLKKGTCIFTLDNYPERVIGYDHTGRWESSEGKGLNEIKIQIFKIAPTYVKILSSIPPLYMGLLSNGNGQI